MHGTEATPSLETTTETPSCACEVSWSIMWSRKGKPVAISPRAPRFATEAVALVAPISAAPAPSGHEIAVAAEAASVEARGASERAGWRRAAGPPTSGTPRDDFDTGRDAVVKTGVARAAAEHAMAGAAVTVVAISVPTKARGRRARVLGLRVAVVSRRTGRPGTLSRN